MKESGHGQAEAGQRVGAERDIRLVAVRRSESAIAIQWPGGVGESIGSSDQKRAIARCSSVRLRTVS